MPKALQSQTQSSPQNVAPKAQDLNVNAAERLAGLRRGVEPASLFVKTRPSALARSVDVDKRSSPL